MRRELEVQRRRGAKLKIKLGAEGKISTAREFKPVNDAPNLTLSPTMFL
jgi:hypothetical protein